MQFRKWANGIVKDYTIKGWVMDDERLKNGGSVLTTKYFDRLLEPEGAWDIIRRNAEETLKIYGGLGK